MTTHLDFPVTGAGGPSAAGELALPAGDGRAPAVIVVHEWWGVNDDMRRITAALAEAGFVALAVDLYRGRSTTSAEEAMQLVAAMKTMEAMDVVAGAVAFLKAHPRVSGKVGITGFCLGGAMTLAAACNVPGLSAAAPFYGIPLPQHADYTKVRIPIQGHYGKNDGSIPLEKPAGVLAAVKAAGGEMELCAYDAGHAFMRASDPKVYAPEAAKLAWERLVAFMRARLA